ncbi:MAG: peptidoglycan DD-metalloendopeptidase family protein [Coriobacteriia bacterium]|nr:peptidoglycan DD-metalloendopeptidase family protein [Coriobacteriia bacterium]
MALSLLLAVFCMPAAPQAFAADTARKEALQEQSQQIMSRIDELQTQLNQVQANLADAEWAHEQAVDAMNEAQDRMNAAQKRLDELEPQLNEQAVALYKNGGALSFLDVIMGSTSFEEFLTTWNLMERVANQAAELIQESKDVRAEADAARAEYAAQEKIAADEMARQEALSNEITATQQSLNEEIAGITTEIAEIEAQEEAEAEEARRAAEAAAAAQAAAEEAAKKAAEAAAAIARGETPSSVGETVDTGSGVFCNPCPSGTLSSGFGYRDFDASFHRGIDLAAPEGTPYYAAEAGTVIYATYDGGYNGGAGNWIVISHGNGLVTKYMHSSAVYVSVGQQVTRGQNIGAVGNTGNSFGAHLHFQVEVNGTAVSPWTYL